MQTAKNIAAPERLFRLAVVGELVTVAGVVALVVALYAGWPRPRVGHT